VVQPVAVDITVFVLIPCDFAGKYKRWYGGQADVSLHRFGVKYILIS